jgi:hypothetical protein
MGMKQPRPDEAAVRLGRRGMYRGAGLGTRAFGFQRHACRPRCRCTLTPRISTVTGSLHMVRLIAKGRELARFHADRLGNLCLTREAAKHRTFCAGFAGYPQQPTPAQAGMVPMMAPPMQYPMQMQQLPPAMVMGPSGLPVASDATARGGGAGTAPLPAGQQQPQQLQLQQQQQQQQQQQTQVAAAVPVLQPAQMQQQASMPQHTQPLQQQGTQGQAPSGTANLAAALATLSPSQLTNLAGLLGSGDQSVAAEI